MRLRHDEAGKGPAIVLLHARPADRTMWREHLPVLAAAGLRAIAIDLPGYGDSPLPAGAASPWRDVIETLDGLAVERATLVGNSLGALVALQTAAVSPERVDGLLLLGYRPHDQPASNALQAAWDAEATALAAGDLDAAVRAGVAAWTAPSASDAVLEHAARMLRRALVRQHEEGTRPPGPDPLSDDAAWSHLSMAVRVGVGELDMPDFVEGGESLVRRLAAEPLLTVQGAAHLVPLEQPHATCALILDLVKSL